ncbi:putative 3',5'-cyclic phosphodiesterase pde-3, variant 2 [Trebouxia sp. C0010 RCD-2024]
MMSAMFENVNEAMPHALARLESKPIKMQTSPDKVEVAVLHVLEAEPSGADLGMMCQHNPLHTFMFDGHGKLLNANKAAFEAFQSDPPGGQEEASRSYEEAYNDVFNLQLDCHRHAQPHKSRKCGGIKWDMIEMWPMQDPIDGFPAVLVKKYDITQQKDLELKLSIQQQELQRQNQELERYTATMLEDKLRLQEQANSLEERLEAVLHDKFHAKTFDAETPIDKTLVFLHSVIKGEVPPVQAALDLYHILSESDTNLRQPVGLEKQLLREYSLDADVGQSILQMLQGHNAHKSEETGPRGAELTSGQTYPEVAKPQHDNSSASSRHLSHSQTSTLHRVSGSAVACPMPAITPELERQLQDAGSNWQFDIFSFAEATPGHTLSLLAVHCTQQSGLAQHFQIILPNLWNWVQRIESGYDANNPYHNSVHVASVLQMTHMMLTHGGIRQSNAVDMLEAYCTYWSAITHDFEHGGVNNDFLIRTYHPWAVCYNDQSPLENHHLAAAVRFSFQPEYRHVPQEVFQAEDWIQARRLCINMVLGTDMKKHFDIVSRFQAAFKPAPTSSNSKADIDWAAVKMEDKYLMHQMVLKCADIGHLAADVATHKRWAYQLEEEFFRQGDKERELGMPISPLMDRAHQGGMTRSQVPYIFFCLPHGH